MFHTKLEQCPGCFYFRGNYNNGAGVSRFCHYMLLTEKRRKIGENGECLSRTDKKRKRVKQGV